MSTSIASPVAEAIFSSIPYSPAIQTSAGPVARMPPPPTRSSDMPASSVVGPAKLSAIMPPSSVVAPCRCMLSMPSTCQSTSRDTLVRTPPAFSWTSPCTSTVSSPSTTSLAGSGPTSSRSSAPRRRSPRTAIVRITSARISTVMGSAPWFDTSAMSSSPVRNSQVTNSYHPALVPARCSLVQRDDPLREAEVA